MALSESGASCNAPGEFKSERVRSIVSAISACKDRGRDWAGFGGQSGAFAPLTTVFFVIITPSESGMDDEIELEDVQELDSDDAGLEGLGGSLSLMMGLARSEE